MKNMSIIDTLVVLQKKIRYHKDPLFYLDVKKQIKYLNSFKEPSDYIERGFFQYKCQFEVVFGKVMKSLITFSSFFLIFYFMLKKNAVLGKQLYCEAIFIADGKPFNIVPAELKNRFCSLKIIDHLQKSVLTSKDKAYLLSIIKRYPFSWYFILKIVIKISEYSALIKMYHPKAIIVCNEYSFTSSILTDYCHLHGVVHINIMHGDKLYYIRDAFFKYDECYVWEQYYKDLFISLRADPGQFRIAVPDSLKFSEDIKGAYHYDYKYYLGNESSDELKIIKRNLDILKGKNFHIRIRPHPRYTNIKAMKSIFVDYEFEDNEMPIETSLMETKNVISLYSTVLIQALYNNINIIIDDLVNPDKFMKLKALRFYCLNKPHGLLSNVLK